MIRHHQGSGRRSVIGTDWSTHHQPTVAGTFTATVAIRHKGGTSSFDSTTGETTIVPHDPHHTGGARIQAAPMLDQEHVAGGQEITTVDYLVAVDLTGSAATEVGDLVDVTAVDDNGDQTLVGRALTVTGLARGSLAWERDITAVDYLG